MSEIWFTTQQIPCICITNRHLLADGEWQRKNFTGRKVRTEKSFWEDAFLRQMQRIGEAKPQALVLREKDLPEESYQRLAQSVLLVMEKSGVPVVLHNDWRVAKRLGVKQIQLPLSVLENMKDQDKDYFQEIGTSVHSMEQLKQAECLGASYVFAGHVFATDCKKDLKPRGLSFLQEICANTAMPVYAIGGIHKENAMACMDAGAKGVCIMSGCMRL